jgi:hypothetical protein
MWAPSDSAKIVRYREGIGCVGGGAFMAVVGSGALYLALNPEEAVRSPPAVALVMGWLLTLFIFVPGVLMILVGLVMLAKPERVYLDERGIWLRQSGKFDLISWSEILALHSRLPQPEVKGDQNSKPITAGVLIQPADNGFLARHPKLADPEAPEVPHLKLPGKRAVQRLTQAIAEVRPDLLR